MKTMKMINISRRDAISLMLGTAGFLMSSKLAFAGKEQVLKRIDEITKGRGAKELDMFLSSVHLMWVGICDPNLLREPELHWNTVELHR